MIIPKDPTADTMYGILLLRSFVSIHTATNTRSYANYYKKYILAS